MFHPSERCFAPAAAQAEIICAERTVKMSSSSKPTHSHLNTLTSPSPRTMRTLRKIQSHQVLSSSTSGSHAPDSRHSNARTSAGSEDFSLTDSPRSVRTHRRARSNSDAGSREAAAKQTLKRPARKTGSGFGIKRSVLETVLRDGPQSGNTLEGLEELRYLVLSTRVEADADGMVCPKGIYLMMHFC